MYSQINVFKGRRFWVHKEVIKWIQPFSPPPPQIKNSASREYERQKLALHQDLLQYMMNEF
jgi:hypothetical protein